MISVGKITLALATGALAKSTYKGTVFQIDAGLGACGWTNTSSQAVCSVSETVFKGYPGATSNPNKNPICHHFANITVDGKSIKVQVVDFFVEDANATAKDIGIPPMQFTKLDPDLDDGIIEGAIWRIE
ncbi:hypothetical protein C8R43DRAFT_1228771 [Mycena crocata]|nr:hypothetical protein C8R43DRAFT_1228771 [Mycena crocata]